MENSFKLKQLDDKACVWAILFDHIEFVRVINDSMKDNRYYYTSEIMNIEYDYVNADSFSEAVGELIDIIYDYCQNIIYTNEQIIEQIERMWEEGDKLYDVL